jgi:hypothetical protein
MAWGLGRPETVSVSLRTEITGCFFAEGLAPATMLPVNKNLKWLAAA